MGLMRPIKPISLIGFADPVTHLSRFGHIDQVPHLGNVRPVSLLGSEHINESNYYPTSLLRIKFAHSHDRVHEVLSFSLSGLPGLPGLSGLSGHSGLPILPHR